MKSIVACVACLALLVTASASAQVDSGPAPDPGSCRTTDDCSPPTSYCNTTKSKCVQCIADLNCFGVGLVCNIEKGVCANCRTNGDCFADTPYCSSSLNLCVECLVDANCGNQGIKCVNNVCGSCGDGVCSIKERSGGVGVCQDCLQDCAKTDLKSTLGEKVVAGTLTAGRDTIATACGPGPGQSGSFKWTAPQTGAYVFDVAEQGYVSLLMGDCAGPPLACFGGPASTYLNKGQQVVILVTRFDQLSGPFSLAIRAVDQACEPSFCPPGPNGTCCNPDGTCGNPGPNGCGRFDGGLDPTAICMAGAKGRGDALCMQGTVCSCAACPTQFNQCAAEKGCLDILGCMAKFDCTDLDCYTPERCASIIDSYGGPRSLGYFDATSLAVCDRASGCRLDCNDQPPMGMGGAGGVGVKMGTGGAIGGRAGASGFVGSGGTGASTTTPEDAGIGKPPTPTGSTTSGGCGCSVPKERGSGLAAFATAAALGLAAGSRCKRRIRASREQGAPRGTVR